MTFEETTIEGLLIIEPKVFPDDRGYFFEAFNESIFKKEELHYDFLQDNQSYSHYGVIRGLHYQLHPCAQTKLVRVLVGKILDVAVDIRRNSPTFGKHIAVELSADNKKQLLIPAGFAHGFSVLSNEAVVMYKCDNFYSKESEGGIRYDDPALGIDWQIEKDKVNVSLKDLELPLLADCLNNFE